MGKQLVVLFGLISLAQAVETPHEVCVSIKVTDRAGGQSNGKMRFLLARLGGSRHPHKMIELGPLLVKGKVYRECVTDDFDPAVHKYKIGVKALSSDSAYMQDVILFVGEKGKRPALVADLKYKGNAAFKVDTDGGMNASKNCSNGQTCELEVGENKV